MKPKKPGVAGFPSLEQGSRPGTSTMRDSRGRKMVIGSPLMIDANARRRAVPVVAPSCITCTARFENQLTSVRVFIEFPVPMDTSTNPDTLAGSIVTSFGPNSMGIESFNWESSTQLSFTMANASPPDVLSGTISWDGTGAEWKALDGTPVCPFTDKVVDLANVITFTEWSGGYPEETGIHSPFPRVVGDVFLCAMVSETAVDQLVDNSITWTKLGYTFDQDGRMLNIFGGLATGTANESFEVLYEGLPGVGNYKVFKVANAHSSIVTGATLTGTRDDNVIDMSGTGLEFYKNRSFAALSVYDPDNVFTYEQFTPSTLPTNWEELSDGGSHLEVLQLACHQNAGGEALEYDYTAQAAGHDSPIWMAVIVQIRHVEG